MRGISLLAALSAVSSAQLLTPNQLASLPEPEISVVPIGAGSDSNPYDANAAYSEAYGSFSASSKHRKREEACAPLPLGSGFVPTPDTDTAFLQSSTLSQMSTGAKTPLGWSAIFQNQQAAVSTSAYMGFKTYSAYDPAQCAADCQASDGCLSFNLFFERAPTLEPGDNCQDPPSTTVIKCSFWGVAITTSSLTNLGQYKGQFHVVITGSNGYQLTNPSWIIPGFNGTSTDTATINAPNECNSYITFKSHTGVYDPSLCAADCAAERSNTPQFNGQTCRFFTSYQLVKNGQVQAQICALYTQTWDSSYATNTGYWNGADAYTITNAVSYTYQADIGSFQCSQPTTTTTTSAPSSTSTVLPSSSSSSSSSRSSSITSITTTKTTTAVSTTLSTTTKPSTTTVSTYQTSSNSIKNCPLPLSNVVASNGQLYTSCLASDYQIPSPDIYYNVLSLQACSSYCESSKNCMKAVYNPLTKICYNKGNPTDTASNWVLSTTFLTLQKVADGTPIFGCPSAGSITRSSSGRLFHVCPRTDYNYPSSDVWNNVASEQACINLCDKSPRCTRASYKFDTQTCHGKGNTSPAYANLVVQSQFNTYQKL